MQLKINNKNGVTLQTKGKYCRENIVVSLEDYGKIIPENIAKDVEILGVIGTHEGGGINTNDATATSSDLLKGKTAYVKDQKVVGTIETYNYTTKEEVNPEIDKFLTRTITNYYNNRVTSIAANVFRENSVIEEVSFPNVETINRVAFYGCSNLKIINFPKVVNILDQAFASCVSIEKLILPNAQVFGGQIFRGCSKIKFIYFKNAKTFYSACFSECTSIEAVVIDTDVIPTLAANTFANSSIANGTGFVYVKDNLVDGYKTATNWSTYASQIKPKSELPQSVKEELGL